MQEAKKLKKSLLYLVDTILGDINTIQDIAIKAAQEEEKELRDSGRIQQNTTTNPLGVPYEEPKVALKSRCTVPLTMMCFSAIDLLGRLVYDSSSQETKKKKKANYNKQSKDCQASSKSKDDFMLHAQTFFNELSNNSDINRDESATKLQKAYRHSLAHSFLPATSFKFTYAISYSQSYEGWPLFIPMAKGEILNVKYLTDITKKGLNEFKTRISIDVGIEPTLNKFNKILEDNDRELSNL
jgi:hypothetical protein